MARAFEIVSARNTGPTDRSGMDNLWLVQLREDGESELLRFSVSDRFDVSEAELRALIEQRASGFDNQRSTLAQFHERELPQPEGSERRVVFLRPDED